MIFPAEQGVFQEKICKKRLKAWKRNLPGEHVGWKLIGTCETCGSSTEVHEAKSKINLSVG